MVQRFMLKALSDLLGSGMLVYVLDDTTCWLTKTSSGSSGYGRFDIDNFTDKRVITLHPPKASYPLIGL
jgi:hypothetical protein